MGEMNHVTAATPVEPVDPYLSMIGNLASNPDADMSKLEKLLDMKERIDAETSKKAFIAAFAAASQEFPTIPLNGIGHKEARYALLKDIISRTKGPLSRHGLALSFDIQCGNQIVVTAELMHEGGHSKTTSITLPADTSGSKNAVQAIGSTQTYGQRYTAQAILGLSLGDDTEDDGASHGSRPVEKMPSWAQTVVQDMPATATNREKAEAIATALIAQWQRKSSMKQLNNEWDRRSDIINEMEEKHSDLWENVCNEFDLRVDAINSDSEAA